MKHARKLTSLLLALVMVFALAVTVAAEETTGTTGTGSITVDNPIEGQNYTAYKIFDVVYDDATPTKHYSYTIKDGDGGSPWYGTVSAYATTEANGLTLTQVEGTNTYVVTFDKDKFSAPKFAETLKNALSTVNPTSDVHQFTANAEGKQVADSLPLGYYFVTSTNGTLCNLTTTDSDVTIYDKNDVPFKKEGVEKKDVEVGQVLDYKITGKVPDTTGFTTYTYEITDTMSVGLTFDETSVQVKVGNALQSESKDTYAFEKGNATDNYTFKVTIYVEKYTPGQPIEVTYRATVNEDAVATVSTNKAVLKYSNKPGTTDTGTIESEHKVYSAKITINKFWKDGTQEKPLENVGFKLYKKEAPENGGTETTKYYVKNETTNAVTWDTDIKKATEVKTSATGEANFTGLANDTYYLVESTTPAGFNPLTDVKTITVNGDDTGANLTVTERVENKAGTLLPSTGGMGTTIFYVLGAVLVVGAGVLLVTKKRMSQSEI